MPLDLNIDIACQPKQLASILLSEIIFTLNLFLKYFERAVNIMFYFNLKVLVIDQISKRLSLGFGTHL
jgi:hypothetical protein